MGKPYIFCDEETEILSTIYMYLSGFKVLMFFCEVYFVIKFSSRVAARNCFVVF